MAKSEFGNTDRVIVPDGYGAQGVILACHGSVRDGYTYAVRFLTQEGCVIDRTVAERALRSSNPTQEDIDRKAAYEKSWIEASIRNKIAQEAAADREARRAARKSKSKSKNRKK